jgi:hypothetical protein
MNTKAVLSMSANTMSNGHMMTSLSNNSGSTDSGIADMRTDVRVQQKSKPRPISFGRKRRKLYKYWKRKEWSWRVEVVCRVLFPLSFFLFNIAYWCHYLNGASHSMH